MLKQHSISNRCICSCPQSYFCLAPLSSAEAQRVFSGGEDPLSNVSAGTELPVTAESAVDTFDFAPANTSHSGFI